MTSYIGVDVGKKSLHIYLPIADKSIEITNFDSFMKKKNTNLSELSSLPIVQFPSPNVEKGLYTVVTVDPNVQKDKSLCLTIEEFSDLPEGKIFDG